MAIFPNNNPIVAGLMRAYKDAILRIDGADYTLEEVLTQLIAEISNGGPDIYLVSMAATTDGQIIATMSNGVQVPVDLSLLPFFDSVEEATDPQGANLPVNRIWGASGNNNMGYIPGTLILNR